MNKTVEISAISTACNIDVIEKSSAITQCLNEIVPGEFSRSKMTCVTISNDLENF